MTHSAKIDWNNPAHMGFLEILIRNSILQILIRENLDVEVGTNLDGFRLVLGVIY